MADYLIINDRIRIPRSEFDISFSRSSGPGGQNVNKLNTKATLKWPFGESPHLPPEVRRRMRELFAKRINDRGELYLWSSRHREQRRNVDDCLEKVRHLVLAAAAVPRERKPFKKSVSGNRRRLEEKRRQSERKRWRRPPNHDE